MDEAKTKTDPTALELAASPGGVQASGLVESISRAYLLGAGIRAPERSLLEACSYADRLSRSPLSEQLPAGPEEILLWQAAGQLLSNAGMAIGTICQRALTDLEDAPPVVPPEQQPIGEPAEPPPERSWKAGSDRLQARAEMTPKQVLTRSIAVILDRDMGADAFKAKEVHKQLSIEGGPHLCRDPHCLGNRKGCEVRAVLDAMVQSKHVPLRSTPARGSFGPEYRYGDEEPPK